MRAESKHVELSYSPSAEDPGNSLGRDESASTFFGLLVAVTVGLTLWGGAFLVWWAL